MKIFQRVQMDLALLGHRPNQSPFNKTQLWAFVKIFLSLFSLIAYLIREPHTHKEYMNSIYMTIGVFGVTIARVSTLFKNATIFSFIDRVESVINEKLKYPSSNELYEKTNRYVETICNFINLIVVKFAVIAYILPYAIISYFQYFLTDSGTDAFVLSFPIWIPFDWKNPFAYLIAVILQLIYLATTLQYLGGFLSLVVACSLFSFSCAKDMKNFLRLFNQNITSKMAGSDEIKEQLSEFVEYTNLKELVKPFSNIFEITLVVVFTGNTFLLVLSLMMIQLDISYNDIDAVVLLLSLFCGIYALSFNFLLCAIGQRLTDAFTEVYVSVCQLEWYLYPIEVQQTFILIILYAQKPAEISFFGSFSVSHEQFKKVVNKVYSYFMVLREFYG